MKILRISKNFCNAYIIIDGVKGIIVDTLTPGSGNFLLKKIEEIGIYSFDPQAIFITHAHFDHAGSAKRLSKFFGIPIITHRITGAYLTKGENPFLTPYRLKGKLMLLGAKMINTSYPSFEPDIVFDSVMRLDEFGIDGYLIHTPGHTDGSSSLVIGNNAVIGDLLMGVPYPQKPSWPPFVSDTKTLLKSIKKILSDSIKTFYPGHGLPWDTELVMGFLDTYKEKVYHRVLAN